MGSGICKDTYSTNKIYSWLDGQNHVFLENTSSSKWAKTWFIYALYTLERIDSKKLFAKTRMKQVFSHHF